MAGLFLSLCGHAAVIALALFALPWMRVRPEPPPAAVAVSLVTPAELAALVEGAREPPAAPAPEPSPPLSEPMRAAPAAAPPPPADKPEPAPPDLAPFNPEAPLGIVRPAEVEPSAPTALARTARPRPRPSPPQDDAALEPTAVARQAAGAAGDAPVAVGARALDAYQAAVRAAIERAQEMPRAVRDRGISGTARLEISLARDGRLARVRLAEPSGSGLIDAAALAAARRAVMPAPPPGLAVEGFRFVVAVRFTTNDG